MTPDAALAGSTWIYRLGGAAALAFVAGYIVIFVLYASVGAPPEGAEAWLAYGAGKAPAWWGIIGLSILTDILLIPIAFALYFALRPVHRDGALVSVAFIVLFVVLDLAVTWPNYAALVSLANAGNLPSPTALGAATYAAAVVTSPLIGIYSIVTLSVGILIVGLVMLRGTAGFGRSAALVGVATGVLGIVSVAGPLLVDGLGAAIILASLLTTLWALFIGYRLLRLGLGATVERERAPDGGRRARAATH
jgi:hypothetical protein